MVETITPAVHGGRKARYLWSVGAHVLGAAITAGALGLGLGAGFVTFLSFGTLTVVAVVALASGDPLLGAAMCTPFGVARGLAVLVGSGCRDAERASAMVDRIQAGGVGRGPGAVNAAALVAVAGGALAGL